MPEPAQPALLEELEWIELPALIGQSVLVEQLLEPLAPLVVLGPLDWLVAFALLWSLVVLEHLVRLLLWQQ